MERPHWEERFFAFYEPTGGKIIYDGETIYDNPLDKDGKPLGKAKAAKNASLTEEKMQIIFQDPSASLDPRMTVGEIIGEAIDIHKLAASKKDRADMIKELLAQVGLNTEHAKPVSARVLRWTAAACRYCPRPCSKTGVHRL